MRLNDRVWTAKYKDVLDITDNFSPENYVGKFQFGEIYRGDDVHDPCVVKIFYSQNSDRRANAARLRDELLLLQHGRTAVHEGMVKLLGHCKYNDQFYLIYQLNSLDTLYHLVPQDSFTWINRVKVALKIACLLKFLHGCNPDKLRFQLINLNAAHIMLDQDYNPRLLDFSMISGGIFPNRSNNNSFVAHCLSEKGNKHLGCHYCCDKTFGDQGWLMEKCDVFAFGILLLMLITKKACTEEECVKCDISLLHKWVNKEFNLEALGHFDRSAGFSLVHKSLEEELAFCSEDGPKVTKLATACLAICPSKRPSMKEAVDSLLNLRVVLRNALKYNLR